MLVVLQPGGKCSLQLGMQRANVQKAQLSLPGAVLGAHAKEWLCAARVGLSGAG